MVADVGRVGVRPAAVLWRIGGHRLDFGQQSRVNARRSGVAVRAAGGEIVIRGTR